MIERLRLRNFRRYRDATLRFQPGVNFIEGQNNVGKTSLFYAIEYAFFGRVENFKTIRSLMQPGKRSLPPVVLRRDWRTIAVARFGGARRAAWLCWQLNLGYSLSKLGKTLSGMSNRLIYRADWTWRV